MWKHQADAVSQNTHYWPTQSCAPSPFPASVLVKFVNIHGSCDIWKQRSNHSAAKLMKCVARGAFANTTICSLISPHPRHTEHSRLLEDRCKWIVFTDRPRHGMCGLLQQRYVMQGCIILHSAAASKVVYISKYFKISPSTSFCILHWISQTKVVLSSVTYC